MIYYKKMSLKEYLSFLLLGMGIIFLISLVIEGFSSVFSLSELLMIFVGMVVVYFIYLNLAFYLRSKIQGNFILEIHDGEIIHTMRNEQKIYDTKGYNVILKSQEIRIQEADGRVMDKIVLNADPGFFFYGFLSLLFTRVTKSQRLIIAEALKNNHNAIDQAQIYFSYDNEIVRGKIENAEFYGKTNRENILILQLPASVDILSTIQTLDHPHWLNDIRYQDNEYQFLINSPNFSLSEASEYFERVVKVLKEHKATFSHDFKTIQIDIQSRIPGILIATISSAFIAFLMAYIGYRLRLGKFEYAGDEGIFYDADSIYIYAAIGVIVFGIFRFILSKFHVYNQENNKEVIKTTILSFLVATGIVGLVMIFIVVFPVHRLGDVDLSAFTLIPSRIAFAYNTLVSWELEHMVNQEMLWTAIGLIVPFFITMSAVYAEKHKLSNKKSFATLKEKS